MKKTASSIYQSSLFEYPALVHGFSTKIHGDMRNLEKRTEFLSLFGGSNEMIVYPEQIHKDSIHQVTPSDRGKVIPGVDGFVYKRNASDPGMLISVHTADCVPVLMYDPKHQIIGAVHAGWRGTIVHIANTLILQMKDLGADVSDIRVVIGPHIGSCCYDVLPDRATSFEEVFGPSSGVLVKKDNKIYLNLGQAIVNDIVALGIAKSHIDFDTTLCTSTHTEEFFSYRKNGNSVPGEILGVIGWTA